MTAPQDPEQKALQRARRERVRLVKLAGEQRYLARSRTVEPGAYYELSVSPWGGIRCSCPGFIHRSLCKHAAALKERLATAQALADEANPVTSASRRATRQWDRS